MAIPDREQIVGQRIPELGIEEWVPIELCRNGLERALHHLPPVHGRRRISCEQAIQRLAIASPYVTVAP